MNRKQSMAEKIRHKITTNLFKISEEDIKAVQENIGRALAQMYKLNQNQEKDCSINQI